MASATKKTTAIRQNKRTKMGKSRKAKEQNQGTTRTAQQLFGE